MKLHRVLGIPVGVLAAPGPDDLWFFRTDPRGG